MEERTFVNIDFAISYNTKLQCIKVDSTRWGDVYMAIIPGTILGMIFEQYQETLFETITNKIFHVKKTGGIRKEILKTLRQKPELFFSCNNGLSTIASEVETVIVDGMLYISRINNWKILNGATTTIAIAASLTNKKIDLNKVFVPLKICVTHNSEQEDSIEFDIFKYSNRQELPRQLDYTSFSSCDLIGSDIIASDLDKLIEVRKELKRRDTLKDLDPEEREMLLREKALKKKEKFYHLQSFNNDKIPSENYLYAVEPRDEERLNCRSNGSKTDENRGVSQDTPKANDESYDVVYSSVFSPAEVKRKSKMLIQVYLHLPEETEKVLRLAQEAQKNAERRDYIPLQCKLKSLDKVDITLNIYGETLLHSEKKRVIWLGGYTKCTFSYDVPKDIEDEELRCEAILSVNCAPIGEMIFVTKIVEVPRSLHPEVVSQKFKKVFISYAHQDEEKVKFMAQVYKDLGFDYFFDRHYLKAGDIFPLKIEEYINFADLFILCWSENAAKSDYVKKERDLALNRAYPKVKLEEAPLRIKAYSIEPKAELPEEMKDLYNFEQI